jgi:hypothetical protein
VVTDGAAPFISYTDQRLEAIVAKVLESQDAKMPIHSATVEGFAEARGITHANLAALRRWCCQAARWRRLVAYKRKVTAADGIEDVVLAGDTFGAWLRETLVPDPNVALSVEWDMRHQWRSRCGFCAAIAFIGASP